MSEDVEKRMQDDAICRDWARTLWIGETPEHVELRGKVDAARRAIDMREHPTAPQWNADASAFARDMRAAFDAKHEAEEALERLDTEFGGTVRRCDGGVVETRGVRGQHGETHDRGGSRLRP